MSKATQTASTYTYHDHMNDLGLPPAGLDVEIFQADGQVTVGKVALHTPHGVLITAEFLDHLIPWHAIQRMSWNKEK